MIVDISLDSVVSQKPLCATLIRVRRPLSLMFPCSRRMMIVVRGSLYGAVSDRHIFGIFFPLSPAVMIGFTQESNISLEAGLAKFCFSVLCSSGFTHGPNAP